MSAIQPFSPRQPGGIRVDTLIRLRWLAVAGQSAAVLVTAYGFDFPLPFAFCVAAIATSVWLNIGLRLRFPSTHRLTDRQTTLLLAFDILQLSALLFLTGGLENPFASLFLAPVIISAVTLSLARTVVLVGLVVVAASLLAVFHWPLPWAPAEPFRLPYLYLGGIWLALVLGAGFASIYAFRVAEEARRLSDALTATELVLAREQHLTQLDGLAAAAAHELGTPLATIALVSKELRSQVGENNAIRDDVELLISEVQRCRAILGKLASLGNEPTAHWDELTLHHLIEETIEPARNFGVELVCLLDGEGPPPICRRNPGLLYGLGNLVENAVDFARTEVRITASWTAGPNGQLGIVIEDDGPGFPGDVLAHLGEPYLASRSVERRAKSEAGSGLGLGLFIAKTLLERSGATVAMGNAAAPATGARISLRWARADFEPKPADSAMPAASP